MRDGNEVVLKNLQNHKFRSIHHDILDPYFLRPYLWTPFSKLIPKRITPNMITTFGAIVYFITVCYWIYDTDNLQSCSSSSTYYLLAFGVFTYQFCDNLDGIHARNTNQSSALGCLVDHGVDAYVNIVWMFCSLSPILMYSNYELSPIIVMISGLTLEYMGNLSTKYSEILVFSTIDIVEFQWLTIIIYIVSGYYGCHLFDIQINCILFSLSFSTIIQIFFISLTVIDSYTIYRQIERYLKQNNFYEMTRFGLLLFCICLWKNSLMKYPFISMFVIMFHVQCINAQVIISGLTKTKHRCYTDTYFPYYMFPLFVVSVSLITFAMDEYHYLIICSLLCYISSFYVKGV